MLGRALSHHKHNAIKPYMMQKHMHATYCYFLALFVLHNRFTQTSERKCKRRGGKVDY
ncbi:hypothetical protein Fmac_018493 [Flemingia macrophylla]|uniref:Uncharacterized protein n=1 Tax=Flemingia macrophylla TaxID=520843 RepID=A0ABD1M541_9FABA